MRSIDCEDKPLTIHVLPNDDENTIHWFLDDKPDTRSSNYLEDAVTEIQVQGLELDYTCYFGWLGFKTSIRIATN